jgi:hypothetical protein
VTVGALISLLVPNIPAEHEMAAAPAAWNPEPPEPDEETEVEPTPA